MARSERLVLNRVFEFIQSIVLAFTPGPNSAKGPKWYQMFELFGAQTSNTPDCQRRKAPRDKLLYLDVRVRPPKREVSGVSPNVQEKSLFSLKVSAEVSRVKYNLGVKTCHSSTTV